jgi:hypothetical protein
MQYVCSIHCWLVFCTTNAKMKEACIIKAKLRVHTVKVCRSSRGIAPLILNLGCRWWWVVNITPWSLYPQERTPVGDWMVLRGGLDILKKRKITCSWEVCCASFKSVLLYCDSNMTLDIWLSRQKKRPEIRDVAWLKIHAFVLFVQTVPLLLGFWKR